MRRKALKGIGIGLGVIALTLGLRQFYTVPIMVYHSVDYHHQLRPNANIIRPENFERHMGFLKRNNYRVIGLDEFVEGVKSGKRWPWKTVVITFDDGYDDNYLYAFPILKRYGFPAVIFAISDEVGKAGYLTWEQIKEMEKHDIIVGSHTRRHPYLPELSESVQHDEIDNSQKILQENSGQSVDYFAYPSGGFSETTQDIVRQAGYSGACTTNRGHDPSNRDIYALRRIRFNDKDSSSITLWAKLSGYYNLFRKSKNPY